MGRVQMFSLFQILGKKCCVYSEKNWKKIGILLTTEEPKDSDNIELVTWSEKLSQRARYLSCMTNISVPFICILFNENKLLTSIASFSVYWKTGGS